MIFVEILNLFVLDPCLPKEMKFFLIPGGKTVTLHPVLRETEAGWQQKRPLGYFLTAFIETMRFEGEECVDGSVV